MLLDVAWVVGNKSWVPNKNYYPFESSIYELVGDYHEFNVYLTHCILSKFYDHAHMLVDSESAHQEFGP